jgi:hypothetical protein
LPFKSASAVAGDDEDYSGQEERHESIHDPYSLTGARFPSYAGALKKCLSVIESENFNVIDIMQLFAKHQIKIGGVFQCFVRISRFWLIRWFRETAGDPTSLD